MIRAVREELAAVVAEVATSVTVLDHIPVTPPTPSIYVAWPDFINFDDQTLGGHVLVNIAVTAVVGLADPRQAQIVLDDLMGKTIPAAVANHSTSAWLHARPVSISNVRVSDDRLSVDLNFAIHA